MNEHLPVQVGFRDPVYAIVPQMILFAISAPCNAACPHCPNNALKNIVRRVPDVYGYEDPDIFFRNGNYLRPAYWQKLAGEAAEVLGLHGKTSHFRISSYGEPLLHKRLLEMIEYSCALGIGTSLISNGSLMNEDVCERIIRCGIASVEVSAESHDKEIYERVKPGLNFEDVMANIKKFVEVRRKLNGKTTLLISIIHQPIANPKIKEAAAYFKEIGADEVLIRTFQTWNIPELIRQKELNLEKDKLNYDTPCPFPFERLMIDPGGNYRLCPMNDRQNIPAFGHIHNNSIQDVWQGARFCRYREAHQKGQFNVPLCMDCPDRIRRSWNYTIFKALGAAQAARELQLSTADDTT